MHPNKTDYLHGAQDFADHLGISLRRAFYLLETGQIPAGKLGEKWIGRRSVLDAHIAAQFSGDPEAA